MGWHQKLHPEHPRFTAQEKKAIHWFVICMILVSLLHEGAGLPDWNFLMLSVLVELG